MTRRYDVVYLDPHCIPIGFLWMCFMSARITWKCFGFGLAGFPCCSVRGCARFVSAICVLQWYIFIQIRFAFSVVRSRYNRNVCNCSICVLCNTARIRCRVLPNCESSKHPKIYIVNALYNALHIGIDVTFFFLFFNVYNFFYTSRSSSDSRARGLLAEEAS